MFLDSIKTWEFMIKRYLADVLWFINILIFQCKYIFLNMEINWFNMKSLSFERFNDLKQQRKKCINFSLFWTFGDIS